MPGHDEFLPGGKLVDAPEPGQQSRDVMAARLCNIFGDVAVSFATAEAITAVLQPPPSGRAGYPWETTVVVQSNLGDNVATYHTTPRALGLEM